MAQSLENRIKAALRSAARLKDVEGVIGDVNAEIADTQIKLDRELARSVDPELTTPEAREARNNAADLEHDIRRLNASLGSLEETRRRMLDDDAEARRHADYDAARSERDSLARHIRVRFPEIGMELLELARRIDASDAQCELVNRDLPKGGERLVIAEHLARDCAHYWENGRGGGPVTRIGQITFPMLGRSAVYLPIGGNNRGWAGATEQWLGFVEQDQAMARCAIPGIPSDPEAAAAN